MTYEEAAESEQKAKKRLGDNSKMAGKKGTTVSFEEGSLIFAKIKGYPGTYNMTFFYFFLV